jgi:hypothetical protein
MIPDIDQLDATLANQQAGWISIGFRGVLQQIGTFRARTSPVNVGFTEPTVTNNDWSAQNAFETLWNLPLVSVTEV